MRKLGLSVLAVSFVFLAPSAFADDVGALLFADYCAACHGPSGKGDGDMANVMTVKAPNLTLLKKTMMDSSRCFGWSTRSTVARVSDPTRV